MSEEISDPRPLIVQEGALVVQEGNPIRQYTFTASEAILLINKLKAALQTYATHQDGCDLITCRSENPKCDCGFSEIEAIIYKDVSRI